MNKLIWKLLRKHTRIVVFVVLLGIAFSAMLSAAGLSLSGLLSVVEKNFEDPISELIRTTFVITGAFVAAVLINVVYGLIKSVYISRVSNDLREEITNKIVNMPFDNFDNQHSGDYISWYTTDVSQIVSLSLEGFVELFQLGTMAMFSFAAIAYLNIWLGIITVVLLFLTVLVPQLLNTFVIRAQETLTHANEKLSEDIRETIGGFNVFYISNRIELFKSLMRRASENRETALKHYNQISAYIGGVALIMSLVSQIGLIIITVFFAISGSAPLGAVFAIASLSGSLFNGLAQFTQTLIAFKSAKPILQKYEYEPKSDGSVALGKIESIEFCGVSFGYEDKSIFSNFNFVFETGKKYALIGGSGSGKTTLLKLLLGLLEPIEGSVLVNGVNINDVANYTYFGQMAYIDQNIYLFKGTIRENITLWKDGIDELFLNEIVRNTNLADFVNSKPEGLDAYLDEAGKNISGGEKQRIALARALVNKNRFVIIDEATSQLDDANARSIEKTLLEQEGVGVIMVSHHFDEEIIGRFDEVIDLGQIM